MHANFIHLAWVIGGFMLANLLFGAGLYWYRKKTRGSRVSRRFKPMDQWLRRTRFLKLCAGFAAAYLAVFIVWGHTGIGCEDLDEAAQCQCYGLEVASRKDLKEKIHWARNGLRMCPESKFFADFLNNAAKTPPSP